jgi:bacterioferritin
MGTKGIEIVGMDVKKLLDLLNKAFADEWLAYYQYWIGAKIIKGPMSGAVITELIEHATDELRHADMLTERIIQLGGEPIIEPKKWYDFTNCGYEVPADPFVKKIVEQNIKGEQCAINVYKSLIDITKDADPITYHIALEILEDEVEHEEDLQVLLEDFEIMMKK